MSKPAKPAVAAAKKKPPAPEAAEFTTDAPRPAAVGDEPRSVATEAEVIAAAAKRGEGVEPIEAGEDE